jgi:hypothetical protein
LLTPQVSRTRLDQDRLVAGRRPTRVADFGSEKGVIGLLGVTLHGVPSLAAAISLEVMSNARLPSSPAGESIYEGQPYAPGTLESLTQKLEAIEREVDRGSDVFVTTEVSILDWTDPELLVPEDAEWRGAVDLSVTLSVDRSPGSFAFEPRLQILLEGKYRNGRPARPKTLRDGTKLSQSAAYAALWDLCGASEEAAVRIFGTLGQSNTSYRNEYEDWWMATHRPHPGVATADDLCWSRVLELLASHEPTTGTVGAAAAEVLCAWLQR